MNKKTKRINLQLFAEEANTQPQAAAGEPTAAGNDAGDNNAQQEPNPRDVKKYSDNDVDKIVNERLAREKAKQAQQLDEAKKLANMNAQQKAEYERDLLSKQLDEYKRKDALNEMASTARKMCADAGINVTDDLLSMLISEEADKTKTAVDSFISLYNASVSGAVKDALKGAAPKLGSSKTGVTKEEIMAIKDTNARQKAIRENIDLFKNN